MWNFMKIGAIVMIATMCAAQTSDIPEYIKQCRRSDPKLIDCLIGALHHLRPYLAQGIKEIEMPSVEPFIMDSLSLQLTGGPQGYRVNLKNMEVFGASNYSLKALKLSEGNKPFEARIALPKLDIRAKYTSSGVLIIIPASGAGEFNGVLEGVTADVRGVVGTVEKPDGTYLSVESLELVLNVKKVKLSVDKIFNNNRILTQATNLFLSENGHEVFKAMQPQLQKKLATEFKGIANQLLKNVPREKFIID